MRTPACLLLTLTVVAAAPQPTPTPPQSSPSPSPPPTQQTLASPFTNCIESDISEIEELRWKLKNTIDIDLTRKKENISFGLLEEDWFRLKLLEDRLPVDSLLKPKLLKLFRLVISALFQAHKSSVKPLKTTDKFFENNQPSRTELNPLNISNNSFKPTTVNQPNVLSMSSTISDGVDNEVAESELQESVLPFKPTTVNRSNVLSMSSTISDGVDNEVAESELQESVLPFKPTTVNRSNVLRMSSTISDGVDNEVAESELQESVLPFKPTTVNRSNVSSMSSTISDGVDNEVAESELQESVLPFNTFASPDATDTTTTLHSNNIDLQLNFNKGNNRDSTFLTLPDELPTDDHSVEVDDITSEHPSNYTQKQKESQQYDPTITEDYQGFNINDNNEHNEEPKKVKFLEEYDDIITPATDITNISIFTVESGSTAVRDTEITKVPTANEETTSTSSFETESSSFAEIDGRVNNKSSVIDETTAITKEATFTNETNKNQTEKAEKDHGTPYDQTESRGEVTEVIYNTGNFSSITNLSRDFTIQHSSNKDEIIQHQHTYNPTDSSSSTARYVDNIDQSRNTISYSERPNHLLTTHSNSKYFDDKPNEIHTDSPSPVGLTVTSENNSIEDDSIYSTILRPFSTTQSMKTSLHNTINETFHSFTAVFPEYPKLTSPAIKVNKLTIYSPDSSQRVIFPFEGPRGRPMVQAVCKNKNTCVKVQNIEFNNPHNYVRYIKPNSDTSSEDIRYYNADVESNRKSGDSENILWWNKIRTLRKKADDR